jgi:hypothetical protein
MRAEPSLPYFTCWEGDGSDHPSHGGTARLETLSLAGEPERLTDWLGASPAELFDAVTVDWVDARSAGVVAVTFDTPRGPVTID